MILDRKIHKLPIYSGAIVMYKVESMTDLNHLFYLNATDDYESFVFKHPLAAQFIIVIKGNTRHSVIAHECVHLANLIFNYVGVKLDSHNDEAQAYLTGYIFETIEKFRDKKLKIKTK